MHNAFQCLKAGMLIDNKLTPGPSRIPYKAYYVEEKCSCSKSGDTVYWESVDPKWHRLEKVIITGCTFKWVRLDRPWTCWPNHRRSPLSNSGVRQPPFQVSQQQSSVAQMDGWMSLLSHTQGRVRGAITKWNAQVIEQAKSRHQYGMLVGQVASGSSGLGNNPASPGQQQGKDQMPFGPTVSENRNGGGAGNQSNGDEAAMCLDMFDQLKDRAQLVVSWTHKSWST